MFGFLTMLFSTLGATGMGSILKILGGIVASNAERKAAAEKRRLARDLAMSEANINLQKNLFGEPDKETALFTRTTRRLLALLGMFNFFTISVLCTIYPSVEIITFTPPESGGRWSIGWGLLSWQGHAEITSTITTGHISLVSITVLAAIIGFYFTPSANTQTRH